MNLGNWILWGFISTAVMTTLMAMSQGLGWTRLNIPYLLGTMVTPDRGRAKVLGVLIHFANGYLFSFLYISIFDSLGMATWWLGALFGTVHAAFFLTVGMWLLPGIHPHMATEQHGPTATRQLEPPGFLALHYGSSTPITVLLGHVTFGIILGLFCKP
ncbi:MAG: hypothetical protein ACYC9S_12735 [Leptospirales bacterium]